MSEATTLPAPETAVNLPTHLDLPDQDGVPMMNCQQPPQSSLLTECLTSRLQQLRPEGDFMIGEDCGIYWDIVADEPLRGSKSPDWFCVLGVPPLLDGEIRRSYVMWHEPTPPTILIEFVSTDGAEEHDRTPPGGKFFVYEQRPRGPPYYAIFDRFRETLEVYRLGTPGYVLMSPNQRQRFLIEPLGVELGLWHGTFRQFDTWWVRAWDHATGQLLPSLVEVSEGHLRRARASDQRAKAESQRADAAEERMRLLLERMRAAGLEPPESLAGQE